VAAGPGEKKRRGQDSVAQKHLGRMGGKKNGPLARRDAWEKTFREKKKKEPVPLQSATEEKKPKGGDLIRGRFLGFFSISKRFRAKISRLLKKRTTTIFK